MEQRQIIIVDSSANKKVVVNTDATNFGELKRAAKAAGINYEGKDWLEGLTKTSPMSDDSLLPVNVPYQGNVTNNLVYMLTNTNKRIKSGSMSRQEAYAEIKKLGLAEGIKKKFGRNFTQVGTNDLVDFITLNMANGKVNSPVKEDSNPQKNYKGQYEELVKAVAKFVVSISEPILNDITAVAKVLEAEPAVKEIDFSKMSVEELKTRFGK